MSSPQQAKYRLMIMIGVVIMIAVSVVLWAIQDYRQPGGMGGEGILQGIILLVVLAFMIPLVKRAHDNIRRGIPMDDERSLNIKVLAGYYAFLISIYLWLAIGFFARHFTVDSATATAILGSALIFALAYAWLSRKPGLE